MQVTEVRLTKANTEDNCLAYGSVTFDGDFVICGIRVLQNNKNGDLFVGFPSRKNQKGEYKDICFPMTADLRENISVTVIAEYEKL